jgi:xanthine dehydrogenase iron-sulfur cluster and FAD-binding subunit A
VLLICKKDKEQEILALAQSISEAEDKILKAALSGIRLDEARKARAVVWLRFTDMKTGLAGNLCRCTGYSAIYRSIEAAGINRRVRGARLSRNLQRSAGQKRRINKNARRKA